MIRRALVTAAAGLLACDVLHAGAQQPLRDARTVAGTLSIAGRVTAADGKTPLRRAIVTISSAELPRGRMTTRTEGDGRYEFTGLPASGSFRLAASKNQYVGVEYGQRRPFEGGRVVVLSGKSLANVNFMLPRAAAITGLVLDTAGEPVDAVWVMAFRRGFVDGRRRLTSVGRTVSDDRGHYRIAGLPPGDYYVVVRERAGPTEFSRERIGYPVSYFPGTASLEQAQLVRLTLGQQAMGVDVTVTPVRAATIAGQVLRSDGSAVPKVRVSLMDHAGSGPGGNVTGGATTDEQGFFRIHGVRGGEYYLAAGDGQERGVQLLDVTGADVMGLTLLIGKGGTLSAKVITTGGGPPPFPPGRLDLTARPLGDPFLFGGVARPPIKPDWTVVWIGLTGPRAIRATRIPDGWWMKAVLRGERDVTDETIEVTHGQAIGDLTIVLDDKPTRIAGSVRDEKGAAAADYTVIAFSDDPRRWTAESRFVQAVRPDHAGAFAVSALPPGNYLLAAVDYVEQGQWLDPEYLESLRRRATKLSLDAGQQAELSLTLIAGGVQ